MTSPEISVIIPVFTAEPLALCLEALEQQTLPRQAYEVIVVDNGAADTLAAIVARFPRVRVLRETTVGSYAARNTGAREARGEMLAFADADCIPDPGWLAAGREALAGGPESSVVGGRVTLFWHGESPTPWELYDSLVAFNQEVLIRTRHYGVTANLFVRKKVFAAVGPFNQALLSGGDRDWGHRAVALGCDLRYCPAAEVRHPARASLAELNAKHRRLIGGAWRSSPHPFRLFCKAPLLELRDIFYFTWVLWCRRELGATQLARIWAVHLHISGRRLHEYLRLASGGEPRR